MRASSKPDSLLPAALLVPTDHFERRARKRGAHWIAGVDEAGRGPLAGPVVVAAVMFDGRRFPRGLNDSKALTADARARLFEKIMKSGTVSVAVASRDRIDRMNILQASLWAMTRAVRSLAKAPDHVLIDGNLLPPGLPCPGEPLVSGDARSVSIAAASIIAKVTRDRLMAQVGAAFPDYGFESHMGYSTRRHFDALAEHGPCPHHRRSFAPIRGRLEPEVDPAPTLFDEAATL